jgi:hypothetical protein
MVVDEGGDALGVGAGQLAQHPPRTGVGEPVGDDEVGGAGA